MRGAFVGASAGWPCMHAHADVVRARLSCEAQAKTWLRWLELNQIGLYEHSILLTDHKLEQNQ